MPMVNGKKYPYTKEGKEEAKKARMKKYVGGKLSKPKGEAMPKAKPC